jgi:hypothetical protein
MARKCDPGPNGERGPDGRGLVEDTKYTRKFQRQWRSGSLWAVHCVIFHITSRRTLDQPAVPSWEVADWVPPTIASMAWMLSGSIFSIAKRATSPACGVWPLERSRLSK